MPDGTTLLRFRRLLEQHQTGEKVFAIVGQIRQGRGQKRGAYASQKLLVRSTAPRARDVTNQRMRIGGEIDEAERSKNRNKSKVRAR